MLGLLTEARDAFRERPRDLATLLALAALTIASYGFARPPIESIYVGRYGASNLPWAWLAIGVGAIAVTFAYNQALAKSSLARLWPRVIAVAIAFALVLGAAVAAGVPHAEFALYVWKDIYIVVLVELFWSVANVSFPLHRARWLYGAFLTAGSLGGFAAELSVGEIATRLGSLAACAAAVPILIASAALAPLLPAAAREHEGKVVGLIEVAARAGRVLQRSRYLTLLVALVALIQIALTVIDYQFNIALEAYAPDVDQRSDIGGKIYAVISAASIALQIASGIVLKGLGAPLVLAGIPLFMLIGAIGFALNPRFVLAAALRVASKALDYSFGRAAKELLYVPLSYREKTEGKAIVDLLSYRVAKALASIALLGVGLHLAAGALIALLLGVVAAWLVVALIIGARFRLSSDR